MYKVSGKFDRNLYMAARKADKTMFVMKTVKLADLNTSRSKEQNFRNEIVAL